MSLATLQTAIPNKGAELYPELPALVERCRAGDVAAFEKIFHLHKGRIYALCLRMPEGAALVISTISADIIVKGIRGEMKLESVSGEIEVEADPADIEAESVSGDIRNSFGPEPQRSNRFNFNNSLVFTAGDGRASIDIESFSGDVILKKK